VIEELATTPATLIWFEAPQRLKASLQDLAAGLGPRPAAVARELTKRFEEVRRGTLDELAERYADAAPPKGEIVIVVGPPNPGHEDLSEDAVDAALKEALTTQSPSAAAAMVASATGLSKRDLYKRAVSLRQSR
jgi:16S rRNA (cytidine1402-2'-O)-methyltransferase